MIPSYLLLCFASFAVTIHCSAAAASLWLGSEPGKPLPNNSYVNLEDVGDEGNGIQCRTDLETCCSDTEGDSPGGDWYFPNSSRLKFSNDPDVIIQAREKKTVELRQRDRQGDPPPVGIYTCSIFVSPNASKELFVGLYHSNSGGE